LTSLSSAALIEGRTQGCVCVCVCCVLINEIEEMLYLRQAAGP